MKVLFIGFTVGDGPLREILDKGRHMPIQTHSFAWNVVRALQSAGGDIKLLSSWPVTDYPEYPQVLFTFRRIRSSLASGYEIPFVNVLGLKHVTRAVSSIVFGLPLMLGTGTRIVLIHGVHTPFLVFGAIASLLFRRRVIVVLTDPPGYIRSGDGFVRRLLKAMDKRIVRGLISESSGVVALTPILAATYAPSKPCLIIDGFAEDGLVRSVESEERDRPLLVYAGGLDEKYGLRTLVEAVLVLRIDCELAVFGSGQLFDWVNRVSRESGRVRSPMSLPRDELLVEYGRADVLVQPRSVSQELVSVSFPSKLIEYIASERPVLSTRIPGISEELDPYLHWIEGDDLASMVAGLERCLHEPEPSRRRKAVLAREHIMATRGPERRGRQLVEFVESVSLGSGVAVHGR